MPRVPRDAAPLRRQLTHRVMGERASEREARRERAVQLHCGGATAAEIALRLSMRPERVRAIIEAAGHTPRTEDPWPELRRVNAPPRLAGFTRATRRSGRTGRL